jgi:hypothetical protein
LVEIPLSFFTSNFIFKKGKASVFSKRITCRRMKVKVRDEKDVAGSNSFQL